MKKYFKYFIVLLFTFVTFISSVNAVTIKETLINGDGYDTIQDGSVVIGVTKFGPTTVVTGGRATKAGSDAAVVYLKENGSLDGYEAPVIYVLAGGSWYALDKNNDATLVTNKDLIDELSNKKIFFVDDEEKVIDIDVSGIDIDESKLPESITYKGGKIYVKATKDSFSVVDKNGNEYKFIREDDLYGLDQSACYTISGSTITGYSNTCPKDVKIPSKVNNVSIDSVGAEAFRNKGIKSLLIPGHIISLGDSAFADNELENVIIEDKYDESSFEYYGQNVFGSFEDVYYSNDLTDLLAQFNDEIVVKVRKGTLDQEYNDEYIDDEYIDNRRISGYARNKELKRLGLIEDEYQMVNDKYYIGFGYELNEYYAQDFSKPIISISRTIDDKHYSVSKSISYTIEEVDGTNKDYLKIISEYETYFEGVKTKVANKDFSEKLVGIDGLLDIIDKYGYELADASLGIGDGMMPEDISNRGVNLVYNDVLYYYDNIPYYLSIPYELEIDGTIEEPTEIFAAMEAKFVEETSIDNYEITQTYNEGHADDIKFIVTAEEKELNNKFNIIYLKSSTPGSLVLMYDNGNQQSYKYYPEKSLSDFDGKVIEYLDYAYNELNEKYQTGTEYNFDPYVNTEAEVNENGLYEQEYSSNINVNDNGISKYYSISVSNPKETKPSLNYVEINSIKAKDYETEESYKNAVVDIFTDVRGLNNIYVKPNIDSYSDYYKKNKETDEFVRFDEFKDNISEKLVGYKIIDFDTNTKYIVITKDFYNREPGSLVFYETLVNDNWTSNRYKYYPTVTFEEYEGTYSEYLKVVSAELKEKLGAAEYISENFSMLRKNYNGSIYKLSVSVSKNNTSTEYFAEFLLNENFEDEFYDLTLDIKQEDYESSTDYKDAAIQKTITDKELTDYYAGSYYSWYVKDDNGSYRHFDYTKDKEEDALAGYEIYDFENNKIIYALIKPYVYN